jgi:endoglucanase
VVKLKDMWLDIGAKTQQEAAEAVRIGDPVTLALGYQEMRNGFANSPGMDNKTGLWVSFEAARRAAQRKLNVSVYAVATVQEEIGLRGAHTSAYGIDPHVGIACDVTHAADCPTMDKTQIGDLKLGGGPVIARGPNMNPIVVDRLRAAAEAADIVVQWEAIGRGTGTDANALQLTRAGVAAGLVSVPNRYMHSAVEMISLDDIDQCAELLATFVSGLEGDADFTPR